MGLLSAEISVPQFDCPQFSLKQSYMIIHRMLLGDECKQRPHTDQLGVADCIVNSKAIPASYCLDVGVIVKGSGTDGDHSSRNRESPAENSQGKS